MIDRLSTWLESSLRSSPTVGRSPSRPRRARWPMDARLAKLSLACCAVGMARPAVGQGIPTWNLLGGLDVEAEVHDGRGTLFFVRDSFYQDIPPGETTVVIEGYSCAGWQWCEGGPCHPPVDGSIEFAIASQSILVTLEGGLTTWPIGVVEFEIEIAQPTTVTWPGGSVTLAPGNPDDRWLYVPVTASPAGFPIVFSAPFALQSIYTSMYVDVPVNYHRNCDESIWLGCSATNTQEKCLAKYGYGTTWFTSGDFLVQCEFAGDEGFHCYCVDKYTDVSAGISSSARASLHDGRFDLELSVAWECPWFFNYVTSHAAWFLELDRPTRLVWDYASCGAGGSPGVFAGQCDGPGSFEVSFPPLPPPNAYGYGGYYTYAIYLVGVWLDVAGGQVGSDSFRIENLRFERIYPADVVADGIVNGQDISAILSKWGGPYDPQRTAADVNLDGQVGAEDLALVLFAWGTPG